MLFYSILIKRSIFFKKDPVFKNGPRGFSFTFRFAFYLPTQILKPVAQLFHIFTYIKKNHIIRDGSVLEDLNQ